LQVAAVFVLAGSSLQRCLFWRVAAYTQKQRMISKKQYKALQVAAAFFWRVAAAPHVFNECFTRQIASVIFRVARIQAPDDQFRLRVSYMSVTYRCFTRQIASLFSIIEIVYILLEFMCCRIYFLRSLIRLSPFPPSCSVANFWGWPIHN